MKLASTLAPLQARWTSLERRERTLVSATLWLVALALLWWIGVSPALRTLRQADAQQRGLAAQVQKDAVAAFIADITGKATVTRSETVIDPALIKDLTLLDK